MTIGWGTVAYAAAGGVSAGLAVVFTHIGFRSRRPDVLMLSFGLYSAVTAISTIIVLQLHTSSSVDAYREMFKLFGFASLIGVVTFVALVASWTRAMPRWSLIPFAMATALIGALQLLLPNGLLAGDIEGLRTVTLFGEPFVVHAGSSSQLRPLLDVYLIGTLALILVALLRRFRKRTDEATLIVTAGVLVSLAIGAYDSLVDEGGVATTYISPFGQALMVIALAAYLAERVVRGEAKLYANSSKLGDLAIDRTAALIAANDQLEHQVARQRRSNRNLASLAGAFETSNALVEPRRDDATVTFRGLLEDLCWITGARAMELRITDSILSDVFSEPLSWQIDDPVAEPSQGERIVTTPLHVGQRKPGELVARFGSEEANDFEEARYLELAANHLASMVARLELVRKVTDSAVRRERQRIAMELHDSVTQRMYAVSFVAEALTHHAKVGQPAKAVETANRVRDLVLSCLEELRWLLFELQPMTPDDATLTELVAHLEDSMDSMSGVDLDVEVEPVPDVPSGMTLGLYRIVQEAVSNAYRHSGGEKVTVSLGHRHGFTTLTIEDDGAGFDPHQQRSGHGLQNIESRAAQLGVELEIESAAGAGTTVALRWPVNAIDRVTEMDRA